MGYSSYGMEDLLETISESAESWSYMSNFGNILRLACGILAIIGMWNMFEKAGEPGWGSLIPYYKTYLLYKIADMKKAFWIYLVASIGTVILVFVSIYLFFVAFLSVLSTGPNAYSSRYTNAGAAILGVFALMFILVIAGLVLRIMNAVKLAQVFNVNGGYAVGIIFLPFVFYMILGLSKEIHYKNRIPGNNGFAGQGGYQDPYASNSYAQNPYQQNSYQQNSYQQNPYAQEAYQQNPYQQNTYQQNNYQQNNYQQDPYQQQSPYSQTAYAQNAYDQNAARQNPYANPPREEAWKTIYDDNANNLNQ